MIEKGIYTGADDKKKSVITLSPQSKSGWVDHGWVDFSWPTHGMELELFRIALALALEQPPACRSSEVGVPN